MTTLQQLHEIVLSRRVPANIFDILGEAAVALRALAEEVEVSKGMLGAITAEIAALRAASVEPAPSDDQVFIETTATLADEGDPFVRLEELAAELAKANAEIERLNAVVDAYVEMDR